MAIFEAAQNNDRPMAVTELSTKIDTITFSNPVEFSPLEFCFCDYQCEYIEKAFADDGVDTYKNDYTPLIVELPTNSDSVTFTLIQPDGTETTLVDSTHGIDYPLGSFTDQPLLAGFRVQWWKIFNLFGGGKYQIKVTRNIFGGDFDSLTHKYRVMKYSVHAAKGTVKIEGNMSGCFENGLKYPANGWEQSIRVPGFFGNPEDVYTISNVPSNSRKTTQIQDRVHSEYLLSMRNIPMSIKDKLGKNMFMANEVFISDYNLFNPLNNGQVEGYESPLTKFKRVPVQVLEQSEADNRQGSVLGRYEYRFEDRIKDIVKRN